MKFLKMMPRENFDKFLLNLELKCRVFVLKRKTVVSNIFDEFL